MEKIEEEIISNTKIDIEKLKKAKEIIKKLQQEISINVKKGCGPFVAAIYDEKYNLIAKMPNTVLNENCSNNHAEMNTIKEAQRVLKTSDLSKYNLSIYVTAEPCIMCLGGIMWSGIKSVYFGVSSKDVEKITGFDEGFKPNWLEEFKKRNINVYGNIEAELGKKELEKYVLEGNKIYKPERI